jgi:hypothetical protein
MDALREFLGATKKQGIARGDFLGLLNILIGRRLEKADGAVISAGCSWRNLAANLKLVRWNKEAVRELGIDPKSLHPRDRLRYWFQAITQASVDSAAAVQAGDRFAEVLRKAGYVVGPAPRVGVTR